MSWSFRFRGPIPQVRANAAAEFDRIAASYDAYANGSGASEAAEVRACKAAAMTTLDEIDDAGAARLAPDSFAPKGYEVEVYGYGSHSVGYDCSMHLQVSRVKLE